MHAYLCNNDKYIGPCVKTSDNVTDSIYFTDIFVIYLISSKSELFRAIPEYVSEPFQVIPNLSEKHSVSRLMKNGLKSIRLNPI